MVKQFVLLLICGPTCLLADVRYTITALVPDDSSIANGVGQGINQFGDSVGSFFDSSYTTVHSFYYTAQSGFTDLGFGSGIRYANGINNSGQISAYGTIGGETHALLYTPGIGFVDLGTGNGHAAETTGLNNSGQVIGSYTASDGTDHGFRYTEGRGIEDIGSLPGASGSAARGINDSGWVTGTSGNRAFLYQEGAGMTDIGPGSGWAVNNAGVVAGETLSTQPVLYMNGQAQLLGGIGGARGINNNNVVVGYSDSDSFFHGFVWSEQDGMQDLNSLIDPSTGWYIAVASAINDNGQIVGWGFSPSRGTVQTPFLLTPIPEPTAWALLVLGSGALLVFRRRRA